MKTPTLYVAAAFAAAAALTLVGCSDDVTTTKDRNDQAQDSETKFSNRTPPDVTGDPEYNNYIKAQEEVYDDPANILWCTGTFNTASSPIFTVPIAGKLTSSSVSYYPNQSPHRWNNFSSESGGYLSENQSVDGMYHGTPAPYRYGFTPGGQYVEFSAIGTVCTTALTEFQRQTLEISAVPEDDGVTERAEEALRNGDTQGAQDIVDSAVG